MGGKSFCQSPGPNHTLFCFLPPRTCSWLKMLRLWLADQYNVLFSSYFPKVMSSSLKKYQRQFLLRLNSQECLNKAFWGQKQTFPILSTVTKLVLDFQLQVKFHIPLLYKNKQQPCGIWQVYSCSACFGYKWWCCSQRIKILAHKGFLSNNISLFLTIRASSWGSWSPLVLGYSASPNIP